MPTVYCEDCIVEQIELNQRDAKCPCCESDDYDLAYGPATDIDESEISLHDLDSEVI